MLVGQSVVCRYFGRRTAVCFVRLLQNLFRFAMGRQVEFDELVNCLTWYFAFEFSIRRD